MYHALHHSLFSSNTSASVGSKHADQETPGCNLMMTVQKAASLFSRSCSASAACLAVQDLPEEDASLIKGMLQPAHLDQLQDFLKRPDTHASIGDDPSLPSGSLRALSTQYASFRALSIDDKARTLSLMPPASAAALLGELLPHSMSATMSHHRYNIDASTKVQPMFCVAVVDAW